MARARVAGAWLGGAVAAFAVYLRLAETRAVNSDGASQALQAWDMLPGYPGYADYLAVRAAWGAPARVYRVGQDTIWDWPEKNLLSTIQAASDRGQS
jgi:hypothetical protein